jgi:NADH dehydrogenase (ubiquinone) 1 alpha subcomplex subunit 4
MSVAWNYIRGTCQKHYSLVPLLVSLGFGVGLSAVYTIRLAVQCPDVSWRRKSNPEPWQHRVDKDGNSVRYKLWQGPADHAAGQTQYGKPAFPAERPPIEKMWAEYKAENQEVAHHH